MPVEILNSQQRADYGRFNNDLSPEQLTKYCYLTDGDVAFIRKRRPEPYQQLGFALQLMTVRFLGTFLDDPLDVPERLKAFGATRLGIEGEQSLSQYMASKELRFDHRKIICREFGYKTFEDPIEQWSLMRWVYARSWFSTEKPLALFDLATTRLVDRNVLLPGATTLERIVARLYDQASERLYARIVKLLRDVQRDHLLDLLELEPETGLTYLQQLRHGPTHQSGLGVIDALKRLQAFRALGVGEIDLKFLPQSRLRAMAQFAASTKTAELQKLTYNRQIATLFAFGRRYTVRALDDAVDLLWIVLSQIFGQAEREGQQNRLATFAKLDAAALLLADVGQINLDPTVKHTQIRSQIKDQFGFEVIQQAINTVRALARPPGDNHQVEMIEKYNRINLFLPHVLHTLTFEAHTGGQSVQALLVYLKAKLDQLSQDFSSAPLQGVDKQWRKWVLDPDGDAGNNGHAIAYKAYTVWVTHRLQRALKKHDLFLSGSEKWGNVQGNLLQGADWDRVKVEACRALDRSPTGALELERLRKQMDSAFRTTLTHLPTNRWLEISTTGSVDLDRLEPQGDTEGMIILHDETKGRMPRIDLPELLVEVEHTSQFGADFFPRYGRVGQDAGQNISVCAALMSTACNLPLTSVVRQDIPALTADRLNYIRQNFIRPDTITAANARLVERQKHIDLVQYWGHGEVASADGLRFVVPVDAANALPNKKYFGPGKGVTYFNFTSDQFTGFYGIVVPGTLRDSMFILEGLLEQETTLRPLEVMTDSASASDLVFALFWLLGYVFSPRLRDIGGARFWRMDATADYGPLNKIARHHINEKLILDHWDDILRIAVSIKLEKMRAFEVMQMLQGGSKGSSLARAVAELGRIIKTLYALKYLDEESYRRRIHVQLNRGESRHALARRIFHGQRGELRQRYVEGQEMQLGSLGFVLNAVVLWNSIYLDAVVKHLRTIEVPFANEDIRRLSPLAHKHIHFDGRYSFNLAEPVRLGQLRPLRSPHPTDFMTE